MSAPTTPDADGRIGARIENYSNFWQKDLSKEQAVDTENRVGGYTDVVNGMSTVFHILHSYSSCYRLL